MKNHHLISLGIVAAILLLLAINHSTQKTDTAEQSLGVQLRKGPQRRKAPVTIMAGMPEPGTMNNNVGDQPKSNYDKLHDRPLNEGVHIEVNYFLHSKAKDTYEGQVIATELLKNGYGSEYIAAIYTPLARAATAYKKNAFNPDTALKVDRAIRQMTMMKLMEGGGMGGLRPITNQELLATLLELRPNTGYIDAQEYRQPEEMAAKPGERLLTSKDIINYIAQHPAPHP
jgi:hypothetical protein